MDIDTLEKMNAQDIFDYVITHLYNQKKPAKTVSKYPSCKYRTKHKIPLKCAVGCLIPDDMYFPFMEYNDVGALLSFSFIPSRLKTVIENNLALLLSLQSMHDAYINWDKKEYVKSIHEHASNVAVTYKLNTAVLDKLYEENKNV